MKKILLKSPAKVNLYLNILSVRTDGFHNLESVVEKITLFDEVFLSWEKSGKDKISFFCSDKRLENRQNTAYKAVELIKDRFSIKGSIIVRLKKNIPCGSGLGGASSNAACVIEGLGRILGLNLSLRQKMALGSLIGSDVNIFLCPGSFVIARGRGEKVETFNTGLRMRKIVIMPAASTSTSVVYTNYKPGLTKHLDGVKLVKYALKTQDVVLLRKSLFNALAGTAVKINRFTANLMNLLAEFKDLDYCLSGSGSAVFVLGENLGILKRDLLDRGYWLKEVATV